MAKFQETTAREDTVQKKPLSKDDLAFLAGLQKTLNTQDTMGNADPRFWVIAQSRTIETAPGMGDRTVAIDAAGTVYNSLKALTEYIRETTESNSAAEMIESCGNIEEAVQLIQTDDLFRCLPEKPFRAAGMSRESEIVKDTLFLTHSACENHLRKYGYNYEDDAHAFAMTAVRSPEFERLLGILQSTDWTVLMEKIN